MVTCEQCRDLLWEDLYGLLEDDQRDQLREHLRGCSPCQAQLVEAQADQQALAQAARLDIVIPAFKLPSSDRIPIPASLSMTSRTGRRRYIRLGAAAAAAVVALFLVPMGIYQEGLSRRQAAVDNANQQVAGLIAQRDEVRLQAQQTPEKMKAGRVCLQLLGPENVVPGSPIPYQIVATDLDGKPTRTTVNARVGSDWSQSIACNGTAVFFLPADLKLSAGSSAHLVLLASNSDDKLELDLPVTGPQLLTQLTIDKPVYRAGDRLFFRSVTLQRYSLTPTSRSLGVQYIVRGPSSAEVVSLGGSTGEAGIGGGDIVLPGKLADGEYTLTARSTDRLFADVTRSFLVGGTGPAPQERPAVRGAPAWGTLKIDFFPEGGDLVAGVENRVYFRVRTPRGEPEDLTNSQLLDSQDREIAKVQTAHQPQQPAWGRGLGMFVFTPRAGETYRVFSKPDSGYRANAELPVARVSDVALSVPTPMTRQGEPISVVLRQTAGELPLLVAISCRGRVVAEEMVTSRPGSTEVRLTPPADCQGVVRVTVLDCRQDQPRPIAERLAYRLPSQRLLISAKPDKANYQPGERVHVKVSTTNEAGKPEPAWLLISAVNRAALGVAADPADRGLPAFFYVTSELRQAQDLEDANFLVSDDPRAPEALDLVLGTHGWRRFSEPGGRNPVVINHAGAGGTLVKKFDNTTKVRNAVIAATEEQMDRLEAKDRELTAEGERVLTEAQSALIAYRANAFAALHMTLGVAAIVLLVAGGAFLVVATARKVRKLAVPRRYLAGAASALPACILVGLGWNGLTGSSDSGNAGITEALQTSWEYPRPQKRSLGAGPLIMPVGPAGFESSVAPRIRPESIQNWLHSSVRSGAPGAQPSLIREYAYLLPKDLKNSDAPDTILWHPVLYAGAGSAEVTFDLPRKPGTYRIAVQGHNSSGRLGSVAQDLPVR